MSGTLDPFEPARGGTLRRVTREGWSLSRYNLHMAKTLILPAAALIALLSGSNALPVSVRPVTSLKNDLRVGMTASEVLAAIGTPSIDGKYDGKRLLVQTTAKENWVYIDCESSARALILDFKDDQLTDWTVMKRDPSPVA